MSGAAMTNRLSAVMLMLFFSQEIVLSGAFSPVPQSGARRRQERRTSSILSSKKQGPDDFFSLYDDEELWNVLNIHRQLTNDQSSSEESAPPPSSGDEMSIHESFLKSQGEETMQSLLDLHESLKNGETDKAFEKREQLLDLSSSSKRKDETTIPPSLHDLVQEAVGAVDNNVDRNGVTASDTAVLDTMKLDGDMLNKIKNIRAIASDVDGTLLTSHQSIHPRSRQAVLRAATDGSKLFFLATGKSRKGALNSLGVEMTSLLKNVPGVFLQGLYCVDDKGETIFEQRLTNDAIKAVERLAKECSVSLVAYDGDNLYSTGMTDSVRELSEKYGEPTVRLLDIPLSEYENGFHKILLVDSDVEKLTTSVRSKLDALAEENDASVTQAVPTMLEWLPAGCSKGMGVSKLCQALGIDPSTELLAIGDAENDVGMLEMASIGVAVGNACPIASEAADFLMEETNDEGGAGAAMETFGFGTNKLD